MGNLPLLRSPAGWRHRLSVCVLALAQLVFAFFVSQIIARADDALGIDVTIRNPDGSPVVEAFVIRNADHSQPGFQFTANAHADSLQESNDKQGNFQMLFRPADKFVAFWNEHGFAKHSVASLADLQMVQLKAWGQLRLQIHTGRRAAGTPISVTSVLTSDEPVACVANASQAGLRRYIFLDERLNSVRALDGMVSPMSWAGSSSSVAADPARDRFYLLGQSDPDGSLPESVLAAFSSQGTELYRFTLPPFRSGQIAVDVDTGNLWLLSRGNLKDTNVIVLDQDGKELSNSAASAFSLTYSAKDKAMWLVGPTEVQKLDADSYRVSASHALPEGVFTLSGAVALPEGGIVAKEVYHPDMPESKNRLWEFDSEAKVVSTEVLGSFYPHSMFPFQQQILVSVSEITGLWAATARTSSVRRYSSNLEQVGEPVDGIFHVAKADSQGLATALKRDGIYEVSLDESGEVHNLKTAALDDVAWLWSIAP